MLTAIYFATVALGFALLVASVAKELMFRSPAVELPQSQMNAQDPTILLECHDRVLGLLIKLSDTTNELLSRPPQGDRGSLASDWEDFTRAWNDEWDTINARCRFSELADRNVGVAYDRLAKVHAELPTIKLKYQSLLIRFEDEQAAELARMRRALDRSRAALQERVIEQQGPR